MCGIVSLVNIGGKISRVQYCGAIFWKPAGQAINLRPVGVAWERQSPTAILAIDKEVLINNVTMLLKTLKIMLLTVVLQPLASQAESAWQTRISSGYFSSVGDYGGDEDTTLATVPTSVRLRSDTWGFKLTVPWVQIDGPGNLRSGDPGGSQVSENSRNEGMGDVTVDVTYSHLFGHWFTDWTLKTKYPAADEDKGLGTGATDYELRLELARRWGVWTGFGHIAYRQRGEIEGDNLQDTPGASLGVQRTVWLGDAAGEKRYQVGGFYETRRAARARRDDLKDMYGFISMQLTSHWKGTVMASHGFSDSSARWGAGTQIAYEF